MRCYLELMIPGRSPHGTGSRSPGGPAAAFTLIELLIVIAVIGVMGALILASVTNAAQDSRTVIARQQQVVLQEALNAWIASSSSGTNSLQDARNLYTSNSTAMARLALLQPYLHSQTYSHFTSFSTTNQIRSEAMQRAGLYLTFSAWSSATNYPVVEMNP